MVCEVHGFEDNWDKDGLELVKIGNALINSLASNGTNGWSVYVIPSANPDGLAEGYTKDGPGRCTIVGGVDINRDFPIGFSAHGTQRCWSGDAPLSVNESKKLSELLLDIKNKSDEMVVIDLHGWLGCAIGNPEIGQYFRNQFGFGQTGGYGEDSGYLIGWAKKVLGAKAALIELPTTTKSPQDVINGGYSQKVINAVNGILTSTPGGGTSTGSTETPMKRSGQVINVTSNLNVRSDASASTSIIGSLAPDAFVTIVAEKDNFYKIYHGSGFGYVSKDYIKLFDVPNKHELIVVSACEMGERIWKNRYKYNFIVPAIKQLKEFKANYPNDKITWIIYSYGYNSDGYNAKDILDFKDTASKLNVNLVFVENTANLINYINSNRTYYKISDFVVFSHGVVHAVEMAYRYPEMGGAIPECTFGINEISKVDKDSFEKDAFSQFYTCNGATEKDGTSFAKEWSKHDLGKIKAAVNRTDYGNILGDTSSEIENYLKEADKIHKGYCDDTIGNYPNVGKDAYWVTY